MSKLAFAARSLYKSFVQPTNCPYCDSKSTSLIERKHTILQLRKCGRCKVQFRFPKDDSTENDTFYQEDYKQNTVTDLPAETFIPHHIATRFREVGRDLTEHLQTISATAPTGKLLDYGCSWGYCVHQFQEAGYEASGFEISRPRVEYGRTALGVTLSDSIDTFPDNSFDVVYSAHCLEHIPNPDIALSQFQRLLKSGGHLFIYVPNCGGAKARSMGVNWGPMIGEKHVLALTAEFFNLNLPKYGFEVQFGSSPYAASPQPFELAELDGEELLVVGVKR